MPKAVKKLVSRVARHMKPRAGGTKKGAAIAALKARGVIKQKGRHLKMA